MVHIYNTNPLEDLLILKLDRTQWLLSELGYIYDLSIQQKRVHYFDCLYLRTHRNAVSEFVPTERAEWVGLRARVSPKHVERILDEVGYICELREHLGWTTDLTYTPTKYDRWAVQTVERSVVLKRVEALRKTA